MVKKHIICKRPDKKNKKQIGLDAISDIREIRKKRHNPRKTSRKRDEEVRLPPPTIFLFTQKGPLNDS